MRNRGHLLLLSVLALGVVAPRAARADAVRLDKSYHQGSTRQAMDKELGPVRDRKHGRAIRRQLGRMDKMTASPTAIAATAIWQSPHVGTGTDIAPGGALTVRPVFVKGVFDRATQTFRGLHVTDGGEVIGVTIGGAKDGAIVAVKDGASPLIGAARHVATQVPAGTTVLRSWNGSQQPAGSKRAALAASVGGEGARSLALETRYVKGAAAIRRVHASKASQGGVVDAGPEYQTMLDAHTGRMITEVFGSRYHGRRAEVRENAPGVDPWQGE